MVLQANKIDQKLWKQTWFSLVAKIETDEPSSTYWFGPFITKRSLKENMSYFIKDLSDEGSKNIKHSLVRCKKEEPLTV